MPKKLPPANLYQLTLAALQHLDAQRRADSGADTFNYTQLELNDLENARKDDHTQTLTLTFNDGMQEEFTYLDILGEAEYNRYDWPTPAPSPT